MLLTPIRIGSLGSFGDLGFRAAEYESDIEEGPLLLNQKVLLPILSEEPALALDDNSVL